MGKIRAETDSALARRFGHLRNDGGTPCDGTTLALGLEPGDIITRTGGAAVKDLHHFHQALSNGMSGETVDVEVLRGGRVLTLRPTLKEER